MGRNQTRRSRWGGLALTGFSFLIVLAGGAALFAWLKWDWRKRPSYETLPRVVARRTDLHVTLSAPGEVQSAQKTLIECELENLSVASEGRRVTAGGSSTILEIIPDGSRVQKGDVLCRLDASDYVELVRDQKIKVEQARADYNKAKLDLQAAEMAMREYQEGLLKEQQQQFEGDIVLYKADIQRQKDRLEWANKMVKRGYISGGQLVQEKTTLVRSELNLRRLEGEQRNLERYGGPITIQNLQATIDKASEELAYQELRLRRREQQLKHFEDQIERCTIRAPHNGFVIYANEDDDDARIQAGIVVRQHMDLFYLPDLGRMEVHALLHESIVKRVEIGMPVQIRVEALPQYHLEGHVISISSLPITPRSWRASREVKNFLCKIQIHSVPEGLLPGMTAEVEILAAHHPNALVIPPSALTVEGGQEVCYVTNHGGLERREVKVSPGGLDLLEVNEGLDEGDELILDPSQIDPADVILAGGSPNQLLEGFVESDGPSAASSSSY